MFFPYDFGLPVFASRKPVVAALFAREMVPAGDLALVVVTLCYAEEEQ